LPPLAPDWAGTDGFAPPWPSGTRIGKGQEKESRYLDPEGLQFAWLRMEGTLVSSDGMARFVFLGRRRRQAASTDAGRKASEGGSPWTQAGRGDRRCSMRTRWRGGRRRLRGWRMRQHRRRSACRPWAAATDPPIENVVTTAPCGPTAELLGRLRLLREGAELLLDRCDQWLRALPRRQSPRGA
jgi:hypothetical protein